MGKKRVSTLSNLEVEPLDDPEIANLILNKIQHLCIPCYLREEACIRDLRPLFYKTFFDMLRQAFMWFRL